VFGPDQLQNDRKVRIEKLPFHIARFAGDPVVPRFQGQPVRNDLAAVTIQPGKILFQLVLLPFQSKAKPLLKNAHVTAPEHAVDAVFADALSQSDVLVTTCVYIAQ